MKNTGVRADAELIDICSEGTLFAASANDTVREDDLVGCDIISHEAGRCDCELYANHWHFGESADYRGLDCHDMGKRQEC